MTQDTCKNCGLLRSQMLGEAPGLSVQYDCDHDFGTETGDMKVAHETPEHFVTVIGTKANESDGWFSVESYNEAVEYARSWRDEQRRRTIAFCVKEAQDRGYNELADYLKYAPLD